MGQGENSSILVRSEASVGKEPNRQQRRCDKVSCRAQSVRLGPAPSASSDVTFSLRCLNERPAMQNHARNTK